jgi:hypothetical protein
MTDYGAALGAARDARAHYIASFVLAAVAPRWLRTRVSNLSGSARKAGEAVLPQVDLVARNSYPPFGGALP